jgi:hypothetical protein
VDKEDNEELRSRVRCEGFWYEVLEPPSEAARLLDYGDDDWVELSGVPDGRPIWLRASRVDYVEGDPRAGDVEADRLDEWIARLARTPTGCTDRRRRRVKSEGSRRTILRAHSSEWWL